MHVFKTWWYRLKNNGIFTDHNISQGEQYCILDENYGDDIVEALCLEKFITEEQIT